ncbi:hypothetical protein TanjilG_08987 [Lupinus angustifolius]|uniref:CD2 antigen cytoplasmic tail-binding protein 2 n=1 Tax=Lupinus angustifolius TaxID=3871 RepID=A0A4P1QP90_LUPAN|nr:hypothetical protein TanjilG_08987 [Lupinus angustifolius]
MVGESSRSGSKRPFLDDVDDSKSKPPAKRVRFPKGKKVKQGDEVVSTQKFEGEEDANVLINPIAAANAAKERSKHRNQSTADLFIEESETALNDLSEAEESYEENENFVDDGIQIEPFNLSKEKEEGFFDPAGNYVEFVRDNEIKDAWLDNVEVDPRYAALSSVATNDEEEIQDLSSKDIGTMKRRIANALEPGETVLHALRRLKGSSDRKAKMSAETKIVFDQLTEDAMKLMENGEFDVYHEKKEVFVREAEGYEKLARAKGEGTSSHSGEGNSFLNGDKNLLSDGLDSGVASASFPTTANGTSNPVLASADVSGNGADDFDMFADDDAAPTDENNQASAVQNDYVYDESSGVTNMALELTGNVSLLEHRYSFNEETGTYDEVQEIASNVS